MDNQPLDSPGAGRGPRRELLGPRPTPLKVRKDSHKIRKPPIAPTGVLLPPPPQQQQEPRQPVIIYTVSPKVIHANPNEFMTLVQRLTGPDHATSSSSSSSSRICGAISPAARFASIEKTKMPLESRVFGGGDEGVEMSSSRRFVSGILSPGPNSLPPISPNLFSPFFYNNNNNPNYENNNMMNLFQHGSNNYISTPFSSNNFISPGAVISPASLDLLHQLLNG